METNKLKVAIIGAGNMGAAIAAGLAQGNLINATNIYVSNPSAEKLADLKNKFPEINTSQSNIEVVDNADIVILAVKPWYIEDVVSEIQHKINNGKEILISIAAGITLSELSGYFDISNTTIFRIIPNTAIEVMQSVSIISSLNATKDQEDLIRDIFNELGKVFYVPESQMEAYMSLSSCGIAYAFRYIRAAMEGGVEMGIYPDTAKNVVLQTLRGAIELIENNNSHPEVEIDKVTTPGGITIKGLNEMEANGFSNAVIKGLKASNVKK